MTSWPIRFEQVEAARERIAGHLTPTPLRNYPELDDAIGHGVRVWIKHENHQPTQAFKARNALSALTALSAAQRVRGIIGATRGNHGGGLAWAGQLLGIPVVICVPEGNNPEKNQAMRAYGAEVIESGCDYDESVVVAGRLMEERGLHMVHSTNDPTVIAGAATMTLEILEQSEGAIDAIVVSVGGGSQAVGALTVVRERAPAIQVFGVQAANASAIHDGYHAGHSISKESANTFADGLATRSCYPATFGALCEGLTDFITATEAEIAAAMRLLLRTTHNVAEGAGAASTAGLRKLAPQLAGKRVVAVLSGGNVDTDTLRRVLSFEL